MSANDHMVGGDHYQKQKIQHWDFVAANNLDYFQGQITKYVARWKDKNGLQDLEKAKHFLEKYTELIKAGVYTKNKPLPKDSLLPIEESAKEEINKPEAVITDVIGGITITIGPDGRCQCECGDKCPLGKTGMTLRCTKQELSDYKLKQRNEIGGHGCFGVLSCETGDHVWEWIEKSNIMVCMECGIHKTENEEVK